MPRAADVEDILIASGDDPIQVCIDEVQAWRRAPVTKQARFDMLRFQRFAEQGIVHEINLTDGQVIGSTPVAVDE